MAMAGRPRYERADPRGANLGWRSKSRRVLNTVARKTDHAPGEAPDAEADAVITGRFRIKRTAMPAGRGPAWNPEGVPPG